MCYITRARAGALRAFNGRCAPLVSTVALLPGFSGSLRLPSFIRGLRPLVSTQPLAASSIVWCAISRFYQLVSMEGRFSI